MRKVTHNILIIPAEGDSVSTENVYKSQLRKHYDLPSSYVTIFNYNGDHNIPLGILKSITELFEERRPRSTDWEIHAQAGFGALVAWNILCRYPKRIKRVFFVGGAPCTAMTGIAKFFHRTFIKWWYKSPFEFFADDPNPHNDVYIDLIKSSSTAAMRADPLLYRNQILAIGEWSINGNWQVSKQTEAFFVPNGEAPFPSWWNNTYNNERAIKEWERFGVKATRQPGDGFSLYSMMPSHALFEVMDEVATD